MELMLLRLFQGQILLQCNCILMAAADINEAFKPIEPGREGEVVNNNERVFYAIQNLLNAAANVSKALWGQAGKCAAKRQPLRDSIGVSEESPFKEVSMRNNFEHFDERLERWWTTSTAHNYSDLNIGPPEMIEGFDDKDMFRWFDPATTDVVFWGQRFNLQSLIDEVQRILPVLRAEAEKPHWQV